VYEVPRAVQHRTQLSSVAHHQSTTLAQHVLLSGILSVCLELVTFKALPDQQTFHRLSLT